MATKFSYDNAVSHIRKPDSEANSFLVSSPPTLFVFGISGATWSVIDPLIAAGSLPNLKRLQEQGCRATLLSIREEWDKHYRPQVAWASMATGCIPAHHGITRFFHTANDLKARSIWEIYQQHGLRAGVYGWPLDWPPKPISGFIVPSHWARDSQTWPPDLSFIKALDREHQDAEREGNRRISFWSRVKKATALLRLGLSLNTLGFLAYVLIRNFSALNNEERSLLLRHAKIELSADIFIHLFNCFTPHFCSFHTFLVDLASHRYWRYHEPHLFPNAIHNSTATLRGAVENAYIRTDRVLGRLLAQLPEDSIIAVVSEHGMEAEPVSAEVDEWRYVINGTRLSRFVGLEDKIIACPVARWIAFRARTERGLPIDTADRFRRVIVKETNLPLFQVHEHGADEVIVKFNIERSITHYLKGQLESLTIRFEDQSISFTELTRRLGRTRSAMHAQEGVFLISGPGIRAGCHLPNASVIDVAPTFLRAAGLPMPSDMDGHPMDIM